MQEILAGIGLEADSDIDVFTGSDVDSVLPTSYEPGSLPRRDSNLERREIDMDRMVQIAGEAPDLDVAERHSGVHAARVNGSAVDGPVGERALPVGLAAAEGPLTSTGASTALAVPRANDQRLDLSQFLRIAAVASFWTTSYAVPSGPAVPGAFTGEVRNGAVNALEISAVQECKRAVCPRTDGTTGQAPAALTPISSPRNAASNRTTVELHGWSPTVSAVDLTPGSPATAVSTCCLASSQTTSTQEKTAMATAIGMCTARTRE